LAAVAVLRPPDDSRLLAADNDAGGGARAVCELPPHRLALRECVKRNACAYLCGLLNLRSEHYR
jgi:hypothetical protein